MGDSGSNIVEVIMRGGSRVIFFVYSNCHFIFMLFADGNMVSAVLYVSRI